MSEKVKFSISGIRGVVGEGFDGRMAYRLAVAFGQSIQDGAVVVGRDARPSGVPIRSAVLSGLSFSGHDVIDIGLAPTPTVGLMVRHLSAAGGIQISASHNPIEWNALKFFNSDGLFLSEKEFGDFISLYENGRTKNLSGDQQGQIKVRNDSIDIHISKILEYVNVTAIRLRNIRVVVDGCKSVGGLILPPLLEQLGCEVIQLDCEADGKFTRPLEPTAEHLGRLCKKVKETNAEIGFAVDPDADRLALVSEKGEPLGEEMTLVLAADLVVGKTGSDIVTNYSSTMALDFVAAKHGVNLHRTKIGEAHVVEGILKHGAEIGGEGNGGVILPKIHPGRDAATGAALICELLATQEKGKRLSEVAEAIPRYHIVKEKVPIREYQDEAILEALSEKFGLATVDCTEGLKLIWEDGWVHLRPSNTEPIIRIIAEAKSLEKAKAICAATRLFFE